MLLLLILIYRSPFFWFFPLLAVVFGEMASRGFGYFLTEAGVTVNGQSSSILSVLVLGAGTDYALLLVARYREELRTTEDRHVAMAQALRTAGPAIVASAMTVSIALLCLSLAKVNGTAGLGPIGAMGILVALLSQMTFLPALLVIVGRKPFWPYIPHVGDAGTDSTHGAWRRIGERVAARPTRVLVGTTGVVGGDGLRAAEPVRRPDAVELVPRRGRVGRGPEAGRRRVPGGRQRADRRDRARPGEGRRGDRRGAARPRRRVRGADRAQRP